VRVILHQVREGTSLRSVIAVLHPTWEGASPRSVIVAPHLTPARLVAIRAEAVASRVPVRDVGVDVGAEAVAGVRAVVARASSRAVARVAGGVGTDPWRR